MVKVLFYSHRFSSFLQNATNEMIIDYFDIEAQKMLSIIGFSYKRQPAIIKEKMNSGKQIILCCDIDIFEFHSALYLPAQFVGVVFDCV